MNELPTRGTEDKRLDLGQVDLVIFSDIGQSWRRT
jgi:hypothetical protein